MFEAGFFNFFSLTVVRTVIHLIDLMGMTNLNYDYLIGKMNGTILNDKSSNSLLNQKISEIIKSA